MYNHYFNLNLRCNLKFKTYPFDQQNCAIWVSDFYFYFFLLTTTYLNWQQTFRFTYISETILSFLLPIRLHIEDGKDVVKVGVQFEMAILSRVFSIKKTQPTAQFIYMFCTEIQKQAYYLEQNSLSVQGTCKRLSSLFHPRCPL